MQEPIQSRQPVSQTQPEMPPVLPIQQQLKSKVLYIIIALSVVTLIILLIPLKITCGSTSKDCTSAPDSEGYISTYYATKPLGIVLIDSIFSSDLPIKYTSGTTSTKVDYEVDDDDIKTCEYNDKTYNEGNSFDSTDRCNTCSCDNGQVACTLMACESTIPTPTITPSANDTTSSFSLQGDVCQNSFSRTATKGKCEVIDQNKEVIYTLLDCTQIDCLSGGYGRADFYIGKITDSFTYIIEDDKTDDSSLITMTIYQINNTTTDVTQSDRFLLNGILFGNWQETLSQCSDPFDINSYTKTCFTDNNDFSWFDTDTDAKLFGEEVINYINARIEYEAPKCIRDMQEDSWRVFACPSIYDAN